MIPPGVKEALVEVLGERFVGEIEISARRIDAYLQHQPIVSLQNLLRIGALFHTQDITIVPGGVSYAMCGHGEAGSEVESKLKIYGWSLT